MRLRDPGSQLLSASANLWQFQDSPAILGTPLSSTAEMKETSSNCDSENFRA